MKITIAHSPDSDDAFMHYAIGQGKIDTGPYEFDHVLNDIESLNLAAREGKYEVTALSIHAYPYLHDRYALLNHGASMGEGYGPMLVTCEPKTLEDLAGKTIAIPGEWTSAALALKLWYPEAQTRVIPFDEILPAVKDREVDGGVIIHEGQLTYEQEGLHAVVNFGVWWAELTNGLPLPLGGNAIRRDLGDHIPAVSKILRDSIAYALDHREEALDYAMQYGRGLDAGQADQFVGMYVNQRTLDYGDDGRQAVRLFLKRAVEAGVIPQVPEPDFVQ